MGMAATRTSPLLKAFAATQGNFPNHTPQGDPGASWGHLGAACGRRGASWGALRASQGRRFLLGVRAGGRAQGELAGERAKVRRQICFTGFWCDSVYLVLVHHSDLLCRENTTEKCWLKSTGT